MAIPNNNLIRLSEAFANMSPYATDAARWRALTSRDPASNGHFIYSVKSTNIYCRPVCPGRLARRANVGFYKTALEAEKAGFRACKRCKPNTVQEDPQERAVDKACILIETAVKNNDLKALRLQDLAKDVGLTPRYFHKIFKDKRGLTPKDYSDARISELSDSSKTSSSIASTTTTEFGTPIWEIFDFNSLVDLGPEPRTTLVDDLSAEIAGPTMSGFGTDMDLNELHQSWNSSCDTTDMDSYLRFLDGKMINPFDVMSGPMMPDAWSNDFAVSTFEIDAAALLQSDSIMGSLSA